MNCVKTGQRKEGNRIKCFTFPPVTLMDWLLQRILGVLWSVQWELTESLSSNLKMGEVLIKYGERDQ